LDIVIPFSEGDREAAMRLAHFIAKIEPKRRDDVELCLVNRFDCERAGAAEIALLLPTFKVSTMNTTTKATGHPQGCNAMAEDIFTFALANKNWEDVDAILFMEPDCVPVARDWIDQLRAEWDDLNLHRDTDLSVVGCFRSLGVDIPHVNGNALWNPRIAEWYDLKAKPGLGWDSSVALEMSTDDYRNTELISNLFKETNMPEERMRVNPFSLGLLNPARPPVLIHGVKDESAWNYAKKAMNL
jgi:hypothetical protein